MLKGKISDIYSKEPLLGTDIVLPTLSTGTRTDENGLFEFAIEPSIYPVDIRHVGYEKISFFLAFSPYAESESIDLSMMTSSTELDYVTIIGNKESNVRSSMTGIERLGIESIRSMPAFMGEVDPIRSITTLPGVSTTGELTTGFNVRGGEAGQNLVLQEGGVIYNPTHLFGLFSAFNPDLVKDINLYKGGGPARYGGRASSVLNIDLKNGNINTHSVSGGVGLVTSRLTIEGPLQKNKISYILGGRMSYCNWLIRQVEDVQLKNSEARFHDLTAKIFFHPDQNDLLSISGYYSYDDFRLGNDSLFSWDTKNLSLLWDRTFNNSLSGLLNIASSNYQSRVDFAGLPESFRYHNSINSLQIKYELVFTPKESWSVDAGLEASGTITDPGRLVPVDQPSNLIPSDIQDYRSVEISGFCQADYDVRKDLGLSFGLRYSSFYRLGEGEVYLFDYDHLDGRYPSIVDTTSFLNNEVISQYSGFEPRISFRFNLNEISSLKSSYYRTYQYMHQISNTVTPSPLDYWISSGPDLKPEIGDQLTFGYFRNLRNNEYEVSIETFYKFLSNAIDYIDGSNLILNESPESGLAQGSGRAYGIEVQLKRNEARLNGWISYTYSRSLRKYGSTIPVLNINNGNLYPSMLDQPHDLSVIMNYRPWSRSVISLNFKYKTGRPITIPVSKFSYWPVLSVLNYSDRNEYRLPDYHRLDLTMTLEDKVKRNSRYRGEWNFSIYNLYGRKNAYAIYFDKDGRARKISILGAIFPSLSYNFKF
jgi:hypothetical protein